MAPPVKNAGQAAAAAPTEEWSSQPEVTAAHPPKNTAGNSDGRPISTVLIIITMQAEALLLVNQFHLSEDIDGSLFPKGVPWVRYHGVYKELHINLVWAGKDSILGVDMLMQAAGKDGTSLFNKYHAWVNAEFLLEKCLVGVLDESR